MAHKSLQKQIWTNELNCPMAQTFLGENAKEKKQTLENWEEAIGAVTGNCSSSDSDSPLLKVEMIIKTGGGRGWPMRNK